VSYEINLELLKISKDIEGNFDFETVWPFILYLFNNWVRHQAKLLRGNEPDQGKTGRDLGEENAVFAATHEAGEDALNFSSEVEFDDRFDLDLYDRETGGGVRKLLNRNVPIDSHNQQTGAILKDQRKKLFEAYHNKLKMNKDKDLEDPEDYQGKKRVRIYDQELGTTFETRHENPFERFLSENFVKLPEYDSGQMKLLMNMQRNEYHQYKKLGGLANDVINMLNEERRKLRQLPALTLVDYNCIDRAASKTEDDSGLPVLRAPRKRTVPCASKREGLLEGQRVGTPKKGLLEGRCQVPESLHRPAQAVRSAHLVPGPVQLQSHSVSRKSEED